MGETDGQAWQKGCRNHCHEKQSMTNADDSAESFIKAIKYELAPLTDYLDLHGLQNRLPKFIEEQYNREGYVLSQAIFHLGSINNITAPDGASGRRP
jgi:hypothetical protein